MASRLSFAASDSYRLDIYRMPCPASGQSQTWKYLAADEEEDEGRTWNDCVKNGVRECGPSRIDPVDRRHGEKACC